MHTSTINFQLCAPEPEKFARLRAMIGWSNPAEEILARSINATLFWVTAYRQEELVGSARIIGDGAMYFYIQDVIVHPNLQGLGVGATLMNAIEDYLAMHCRAGATVGLMAAQGKEDFYRKYGYLSRDGEQLGLGMCRFI